MNPYYVKLLKATGIVFVVWFVVMLGAVLLTGGNLGLLGPILGFFSMAVGMYFSDHIMKVKR